MGAGRGMLGYAIRLLFPRSRIVLVERAGIKRKVWKGRRSGKIQAQGTSGWVGNSRGHLSGDSNKAGKLPRLSSLSMYEGCGPRPFGLR
jgi:hypothetical protein